MGENTSEIRNKLGASKGRTRQWDFLARTRGNYPPKSESGGMSTETFSSKEPMKGNHSNTSPRRGLAPNLNQDWSKIGRDGMGLTYIVNEVVPNLLANGSAFS